MGSKSGVIRIIIGHIVCQKWALRRVGTGEIRRRALDGKRVRHLRHSHVLAAAMVAVHAGIALWPVAHWRLFKEESRLSSWALSKIRGRCTGRCELPGGTTMATNWPVLCCRVTGRRVAGAGRHMAKHAKLQGTVVIAEIHTGNVKIKPCRIARVKVR